MEDDENGERAYRHGGYRDEHHRHHGRAVIFGEVLRMTQPTEEQGMMERCARALYEVSSEPEHGDTWEALSEGWKENLREHVRAILTALRSDVQNRIDWGDKSFSNLYAARDYLDAILSEGE